ncbi:thioesterase family protein [Peribacillus sp. SCS-155]|uniref:thioesterase family protein n=1 Tax=Peribacillus sedimenti TaxID=3115297 RepID=UPI0039063FE9
MKEGIKEGQKAFFECLVTPHMFAQFEGNLIHPAYSTATMVYHMEYTSRKLILPYLDEDEEGMGASVNIRHLAPAAENNKIQFIAIISRLDKNIVYSEVEARNEKGMIGTGTVVQIILPKKEIARRLEDSR